jgi:hypothetical protein
LAEEYYNFLEAPAKNFTWFENSAHDVMYDEPDKTNQELIRIANEVLTESDQEGAAQPLVSAELLAELETYIEESREAFNIPGAAVAIVQGERSSTLKGSASRNLAVMTR